MMLAPGTKLGSYEIVAPLGAGGMGEVYRARDARLDRSVAIKILPAEFSADSDRLHRFEREARSASALNHPNIVTIYELGQDGSTHYIAMELIEGKTLRELLVAGVLPIRKAIEIAAQVAEGLSKAHEAGIAHRDLKPENLMVSRDGFVKILDFGLAKLASAGGEQAGDARHVRVADATRSGTWNGAIHVTRAGQRRSVGFPVRPVLVRLGGLRDGDRQTRLSQKHSGGDTNGHSPGTSRTDRSAKPRRPGSAVLGYREVPGERAR